MQIISKNAQKGPDEKTLISKNTGSIRTVQWDMKPAICDIIVLLYFIFL